MMGTILSSCARPTHEAASEHAAAEAQGACTPTQIQAKGILDGAPSTVTTYGYDYRCASILRGPFWGGTDLLPSKLIGRLSIVQGKVSSDLPLSAFVDLADPSEINISRDGKIVEIIGAGESRYIASLKIDRGKIAHRMVTHPGFEADVYEKTEYKDAVE